MNFPFVLNLTSLMAHAAKEAREAVAEGKSGKINFLGATQYDIYSHRSEIFLISKCLSAIL